MPTQNEVTLIDMLMRLWPLVSGFVVLVIWCVRLEAEVRYLREDHEEHKKAQKDKDTVVWQKFDHLQLTMSDVAKAVARIEGLLGSHNKKH